MRWFHGIFQVTVISWKKEKFLILRSLVRREKSVSRNFWDEIKMWHVAVVCMLKFLPVLRFVLHFRCFYLFLFLGPCSFFSVCKIRWNTGPESRYNKSIPLNTFVYCLRSSLFIVILDRQSCDRSFMWRTLIFDNDWFYPILNLNTIFSAIRYEPKTQ